MQTLLLPGMDGTGRLFRELLTHLPANLNARAVSYPADRPLGYDALLELIEIPAGPFALVAESFSGPLAIRLAQRHADRVSGLVLVASFVRNPSRFAARAAAMLGPYLFRVKPRAVALRRALLDAQVPEETTEEVRSAISSVAPEVLACRLKEIVAVDVAAIFASLRAPTLYLAGSHDQLVGPKEARHLKTLRTDLHITVLDAPHLLVQAKPVEAAKVIARFLTEPAHPFGRLA